MQFETDYFRDDNGKEYIKTYLDNLKKISKSLWEKVWAYLKNNINDSQYHIMPFWKPLGGGIYEIRLRFSKLKSRIYCCFSGERKITLLLGGDKKNQERDILKARQLKVKVEERIKYEKNKSR